MNIIAYILIIIGVVVCAFVAPLLKSNTGNAMRAITIFGGAYLLGVCCLDLLPETTTALCSAQHNTMQYYLPLLAILAGFLIQQVLDGLTAHTEHGHTEPGFTILGLMVGLSLHALLEGMPLAWNGTLNLGLLIGILVHNIPVALLLSGLMAERGYTMPRIIGLLALFGVMSPLGSIVGNLLLPSPFAQQIITGMVVGILLHVSSSILFDHKRNHFSWYNIAIVAVAFFLSALIITI